MIKTFLNKKSLLTSWLRLILALVAGTLVYWIDLSFFEFLTYDWRIRLNSAPPISQNLVLISIDKKSIAELSSEIGAEHHRKLIENLLQKSPQSIVYTINREDMVPISGTPDEIQKLGVFLKDLPVYLGRDALFDPADPSQSQFQPPYDNFKTLQAPITRDNANFGKDKVTRRAVVSFYGKPTMHNVMAQKFSKMNTNSHYRGEFKFYNSQQVFVNFRPTGSFKIHSFTDVLNNRIPDLDLKNKVVLIGNDSRGLVDDYTLTPYSREVDAMTNLETHANIIETLILNNGFIKTPDGMRWFLTCLVSIITVFVVLKVRPSTGLITIVSTLVGIFILSYLLLYFFGVFVEIAHPLLAVFICYYFFIPYRLIVENRRSWEYYHKNKLLTQVEELKSNFMRMMSHDLKTPLARIQGMADIVKSVNNLSEEQKRAIDTISESSEELTEFIGSILSLGRIESKEVKLNVQSKDINSLLDKVIKKFDFQIKAKNIEIHTEFEPLFSVQVDEELIKQVFSNLIENAIKYSPENSRILVTTEEKDGKVLVQISDQGMGISKKDQGELFTKFYRSPEVVNSPIKGSGLGLYLAKYFVELHSGNIRLESEPQMGSTFTVELPTELEI